MIQVVVPSNPKQNTGTTLLDNETSISVFQIFAMKPTDGYETISKKILQAMKLMHMQKREKGSVNDIRKFNSLRGRWFGETKIKIEERLGIVLERGSIIHLNLLVNSPYYVIYIVYRDNSSKKWFPAVPKDSPSWPIIEKDEKRYRLGIREVEITSLEGNKCAKMKNDILDGANVRKSIQMIQLQQVKSLDYFIKY